MNLIVRQVYHYSNFKFVEVFSVQVKFLVFYKSVNTQTGQFLNNADKTVSWGKTRDAIASKKC